MLINKVPRLACRTQVDALLGGQKDVSLKPYPAIEDGESWNPVEEVLVEPLPHLPVQKDLAVDMTKFYRFLQAVQPVLRPAAGAVEREYRMEPSAVRELERYTNCILCGACYGACPVCGENPEYLGPAALAQLYRFHIDPREARGPAPLSAEENRTFAHPSRLALADQANGWWACRFYTNCHTVCPKGVPPNLAIGHARQELESRSPHPRPLPEGEGRGEGGPTSAGT